MVDSLADLRVGDVLDDGECSTVYRATRRDGTPVVLKVLTAHCDDAAHRAGLMHELELTQRVAATSVIGAYGSTTHEGRLALVLEDFGGEALSQTLASGSTLGISTSLELAIGIARSLAEIHRAGIVHRDVKPSNVIHRADTREVRLTGLGIAVRPDHARAEVATWYAGTPAYMAPEQAGPPDRPVDRRADLYGLGLILYELFTGRRPFEASDALQWTHCHAAQVPRPLDEIEPRVPRLLSAIVLKLLAKSPDQRYQSAGGVEHDLARAQQMWQRTETVAEFELASADRTDAFRLGERLHGRDREITMLERTWDRVVAAGRSEVVAIAGAPGVGKTALVRALLGPVARQQGYFASGKFDQYRRHLPYSAIAEVGSALVDQLLTSDPQQLVRWRAGLLRSVDGNAQVLIDIIPELRRVLGAQPSVAELSPVAAQNRLHHAVRTLVRAFDQPMVVFLDDLQWADPASLGLLEALLAQGADVAILMVLAYREQEITEGHPTKVALDRIRADSTPLQTLRLGPIELDAVRSLLRDTLHAADVDSDVLAALVTDKTAGNPLFVREFVRTLHLDGLLRFDEPTRAWRFDPVEVEARASTDNVVDLLVERLRQLPAAAREAVRLAAFLGTEFEISDLAAVIGSDPAVVAADLHATIEHGLIGWSARPDGTSRGRFAHDRIQQAAYALTAEPDRPSVHLAVARLWWLQLGADARAERIFEIANHLDASLALVTDPGEREQLLELFVMAARRAKSATAYLQARTYLERAAELLTETGWRDRFELTFDVHVEWSECNYLAGSLEAARTGFEALLGRARTDLERARIHYLQVRMFQVAGDMAAATEVCVRGFAVLGLQVPASAAEAGQAVEVLYRDVAERLGARPIATRVDDPPMTEPRIRLLADLLEASGPPVYMVRPELFPWVALQLVDHSLRHGNAEASCYGYGIYALLRAAVLGDVEGGHALSHLAIQLNARLGGVKLEGCMLHLLGDHVNFWKEPIATDLPILERGFAACVRAGDHIYSNYIGLQAPWHLYESGAPLAEVAAMIDRYAGFARQTRYEAVHWTLQAERHFVLALAGRTHQPGQLGADGFDEAEALAEVTKASFGCGIVYLHILQLVARYTFGDYEGALEAADRAAPELGSAFSMPIYVTYGFYRGLTLAALYDRTAPAHQPARLAELTAHHQALCGWATTCPANFADKAALLGAERARVGGDVATALRLFEEARLAARSQGFVQYEALSCELAAHLYGTIGVDFVQRTLLADAIVLYRSWGATGKAAALQARSRGWMRAAGSPAEGPLRAAVEPESGLASVIKAAQSLSAEILLPRLLPRLMTIVVEYAGAERGWLLLLDGANLVIAARASVGGAAPSASPQPDETIAGLPASVLHYVQHTGEPVLIHDASVSNRFGHDPYFQGGLRRSVLCKPIQRHGRLVGMFYLENDLRAGGFGPERLATLEVLATQTAISVENSRLYEASQAAVAARDEFLAIASHELRTPLAPLAMQVHRLTRAIEKRTLKDLPEPVLAKLAQTCTAQIQRMERLVGALLDVSRIESGRMTLQREPVDLGAVARAVVEEYASAASAAGCEIALHLEPGVVGRWDRLRLEQVVGNLLLNALKFGRGRPITVRVQRSDAGAELEVGDEGVGVGEVDRERIFQRFERVQSTSNVDGLGLGLFIVRAIVEAHDGRIKVDGAAGTGAVFGVTLPMQ